MIIDYLKPASKHLTYGIHLCLLILLSTSCTTRDYEPKPLSTLQRNALIRRAKTPAEAGIRFYSDETGAYGIRKVRGVDIGKKTSVPFANPGASKQSGYPIVKLLINNKPVNALLDTGASTCVIDYYAAKRTGLIPLSDTNSLEDTTLITLPVKGLGGDGNMFLGIANTTTLGDINFTKVPFFISDNKWSIVSYGWLDKLRVEAVIGTDLLKTLGHVTIDYKRKTVHAATGGTYEPDPKTLVSQTSLLPDTMTPTIEIRYPEQSEPISAVLDTGGRFGLWLPYDQGWILEPKLDRDQTPFTGNAIGGATKFLPAGNRTIRIDGTKMIPTPASVSLTKPHDAGFRHILIGSTFLKSYRVTFDFTRNQVFFEKP